MTSTGTFSFDAPGDAARAAELRRVKALATLVLAGTLALFVTAKMLLPVHPAFGFIAAFAEAATIGGLADWYAVVALFKQAVGAADPAHRDHPEQSAPHRRQARRIHRGAFSRSRTCRSQVAPDRLRLFHCRLAARPQAQRRSRPLHAAAVARGGYGDGNIRPDDVHHPPDHHPVAGNRSGAARRRHAARASCRRAGIRACSTTSCAGFISR